MVPAIIWRGFSQCLYGGGASDICSLAFLTLNKVHLLLTAAGERNLQIGAHVYVRVLAGYEDLSVKLLCRRDVKIERWLSWL